MSTTKDYIDDQYVKDTITALAGLGDDVLLAARIEFCDMKITGLELQLARLSKLHRRSTAESVLRRLREDKALITALHINGIDPSTLAEETRARLNELKTTKPDRCLRAKGAGRPSNFIECTQDMFGGVSA